MYIPRLTVLSPHLYETVSQLGLVLDKRRCLQVVETHGVSLANGGPDESSEGNKSGGERELHDERLKQMCR